MRKLYIKIRRVSWTNFFIRPKNKLCVCAQQSIGMVGWHIFLQFFSNNVSAIKENTAPKCLKSSLFCFPSDLLLFK